MAEPADALAGLGRAGDRGGRGAGAELCALGLDAEATAPTLWRGSMRPRRESLWRAPGLSLADLAKAARAKPSIISGALNEGRGESFHGHVNRHRVAEAQDLLRETDLTVLEIAHATGFKLEIHLQRGLPQDRGHDALGLAGGAPRCRGLTGRACTPGRPQATRPRAVA